MNQFENYNKIFNIFFYLNWYWIYSTANVCSQKACRIPPNRNHLCFDFLSPLLSEIQEVNQILKFLLVNCCMILFWETKIFFQVTNFQNDNIYVIETDMLKVSWKYYVLLKFTYLEKGIKGLNFPMKLIIIMNHSEKKSKGKKNHIIGKPQ